MNLPHQNCPHQKLLSQKLSHQRTALQTAADIASGKMSARAVTEACLARIQAHENEINAFNVVMAQQAIAEADRIDVAVQKGKQMPLFAGIPIALKDNICLRGVPTSCSSKMLEGWCPPYDATVVQLLRQAGAVVIGKTNLDEFAMGSSTENSAFGPTRNPRNTTRVPGGSSGGSAAAVAARFAPLALGSDTGGSVRQPAALCGVVGLKPTYGTVSRYGLVAFASSLDQIGTMAANVADAAALYDVISGHDPMDSTSVERPLISASDRLDEGVDGLKVGVLTELCGDANGSANGISHDVSARVGEAVAALESAGAEVMSVSAPSVTLGLSAYYLIAPAEASSNLARYDGVRYGLRVERKNIEDMNIATRTAGFGPEVKRRIMLGTYALSAGYYDAFYNKALKARTLMSHDFAKVYKKVDMLICPTTPTTAFELGAKTSDPMLMYMNDVCTIPSNLTGHPAVSVPFKTGADGLPVGVQIMGPAFSEPVIFRAAAVIERAASNGSVISG